MGAPKSAHNYLLLQVKTRHAERIRQNFNKTILVFVLGIRHVNFSPHGLIVRSKLARLALARLKSVTADTNADMLFTVNGIDQYFFVKICHKDLRELGRIEGWLALPIRRLLAAKIYIAVFQIYFSENLTPLN